MYNCRSRTICAHIFSLFNFAEFWISVFPLRIISKHSFRFFLLYHSLPDLSTRAKFRKAVAFVPKVCYNGRDSRREPNPYALRRVFFASFAKSRLARCGILLRLALTKSIKKFNAGGCCAVLREQIFRRCKEKMRSNIRYCEYFLCSRCRYLPLKTVWVRLSSAIHPNIKE